MIDLQEYNVKKMVNAFKLTSPKKVTGINRRTKTISGKVDKRTYAALYGAYGTYGRMLGGGSRLVYKNGKFQFKTTNLKKYNKNEVCLILFYKNRYEKYGPDVLLKMFRVTLKK